MKKFVLFFAAAIMTCSNMQAQRRQMSQEELEKMRTERVQRQTENMSKELKLEGEAKTAFETTYSKYLTELNEANPIETDRRNRDEETKAEKMTDEECYAKIKENLERQEKQIAQSQKRLEITKKYMAELLPTLSAQQLYKVFGERQRNFGGAPNFNGQRGNFGGGNFGGGQRGNSGGGNFGGGGF